MVPPLFRHNIMIGRSPLLSLSSHPPPTLLRHRGVSRKLAGKSRTQNRQNSVWTQRQWRGLGGSGKKLPGNSPVIASSFRQKHHAGRNNGVSRRWQSNSTEASSSSASVASEGIPEPSFDTLRLVALTQAIPFVGFGFMDNAILIIAGDAIDTSLGIYLGISTLCAAAIGNIISDLAGIGLGTMIEDFCANVLKLPAPDLTAAQRTLRSVRTASNLGMAVGMTFGCIVGMCPLMFLDTSKVEQMKKKAHLEALFQDVVEEAKSLVQAESTCLYLRVHMDKKDDASKYSGTNSFYSSSTYEQYHPSAEGEHFYAMFYQLPDKGKKAANSRKSSDSATIPSRFVGVGESVIGRAALSGEALRISDLQKDPDYLPVVDEHLGRLPENLRHLLVVPVLDGQGRAIAVLRALNKTCRSGLSSEGFTDEDVQTFKSLASHISVSLQSVYRDEADEEMRLRDTIRILKEHRKVDDPYAKKEAPARPGLFPSN